MIEELDKVLQGSGQPGLTELRELLQELVAGPNGNGRLLDQQTLQPRGQRVSRLRFAIDGQTRSVVVKRLKPEIAIRNELIAQRWLPAVRLAESGPPLLASVAARSGECVWHVYDDLGPWELDPCEPGRERVQAAVELIARVHTRFAGHALLGEVRLHGGDFGIHFYETNVHDAICALEAVRPPGQHQAVRAGLLERLHKLRADLPRRARALSEMGGPETLLHGDLWAINVFVIRTDQGLKARLIDWDHAAVGPASYDLSTFLMRFPESERLWILDSYREAVAPAGWRLPGVPDLNLMFETAELARFANRIIWPAIALVQDQAEWGFEALAEVEQWFGSLEPVLTDENKTGAGSPALR
jgi:Ser/Thr protein kinase RdoA (MazF antagonist)